MRKHGSRHCLCILATLAVAALPAFAAEPSDGSAVRSSVVRRAPEQAGPTWKSGTFSYDGAGNIYRIGIPGAADGDNMLTTYSYDLLSRLVATSHQKQDSSATGLPRTEVYSYDLYGNLLSMTLKDGSSITITPDAASNRLENDVHSPYTVSYDKNGNLIQYNGDTYAYDALNTVVQQGHDSGMQNFYLYNADDERVGVKDGRTAQWTWSLRSTDANVIRQYTSSAIGGTWSWANDHVYAGSHLLAGERPGGRRHFHLDHLGSPRLITDNSRNTISQHDYTPFGTELTSMRQEPAAGFGNEDTLNFTGHERDFTGGTSGENEHYLDYMHARYYTAIVGRFLTMDPAPDSAVQYRPQSWNRYSYAWNDPMILSDPTGKRIWLTGSAEEQDMVLQAIEGSLEDPTAAGQLIKVTHADGSVEVVIAGDPGAFAASSPTAATVAEAILSPASITIVFGK